MSLCADRIEGNGFLHVERPEPERNGQSPSVLLADSARLPGNLRYGSIDGSEVYLLGEARRGASNAELEEASQAGLEERIEAALEASGFVWKRREAGWAVPASDRLPREIQITADAESVRVEAVLLGWDAIGDVEMAALGRLLCRAQFGLRFARCELTERRACVVSRLDVGRIECELPDGLAGVAAASRLLAREVGVLLAPEMARTYLAFLERAG